MKKILLLFVCLFVCWVLSAQQRIKVACVGNSITYGTGLSDRATQSYPVKLQKLLGERYEVENFGKPGATLLNQGHRPYTRQEEYRKALDFAGDIVVIHLGINDTDPRNWPNYRDFFVKDYLKLIDTFREANPAVRIILISPSFSTSCSKESIQIESRLNTLPIFCSADSSSFKEISSLPFA